MNLEDSIEITVEDQTIIVRIDVINDNAVEISTIYEILLYKLSNVIKDNTNSYNQYILHVLFENGLPTGLDIDKFSIIIETKLPLKLKRIKTKEISASKMEVQYVISKIDEKIKFLEVRVAVVGNVDAGKSTLLGVLSNNILDDGRGNARSKVLIHEHEKATGRTSSVGNISVFFDYQGLIVDKKKIYDNNNLSESISKAISFIDLAGHEKYLKTTIFGLLGYFPDYVMMIIGANMGTVGMTNEHFLISSSLGLPQFIVITKIDLCPPNILKQTKLNISKMVKSVRKKAYLIRNDLDAMTAAISIDVRICPVFLVSNVTGENIDILKRFLYLLLQKSSYSLDVPPLLYIDSIYLVTGVGTVVGGILKQGFINVNDTLLYGPMLDGSFTKLKVKSIHRMRTPVQTGYAGQYICLGLKSIHRSDVRKGMVLIGPSLKPNSCFEFSAKIKIFHHSTTISSRYNAVMHIASIRQTAKFDIGGNDPNKIIRSGEECLINFKFMRRPEYLVIGDKLIFREGSTRGYGEITSINPYSNKINLK